MTHSTKHMQMSNVDVWRWARSDNSHVNAPHSYSQTCQQMWGKVHPHCFPFTQDCTLSQVRCNTEDGGYSFLISACTTEKKEDDFLIFILFCLPVIFICRFLIILNVWDVFCTKQHLNRRAKNSCFSVFWVWIARGWEGEGTAQCEQINRCLCLSVTRQTSVRVNKLTQLNGAA